MNFLNSKPRTVSILGSWLGMMILLFGFFGSPELVKAQYCLAGFDEDPTSGIPDEWIAEVTFADLTNTSSFGPLPPDPLPGYQDFTALSANVDAGSSYPISVTPGYEGTAFTESFRVYIDWDQDDIFQEDEGYDLGSSNATVNGTIAVPVDALGGTTRMRVIMLFGTFDYLNGCAPNQADFETFGEAEDYSVNVTVPACLPPAGLAESAVTGTDATISWTDVAGDVYLEYGIDPFTPGTDENAGGGTVIGPLANSPEVLSGVLSPSSTYTVYARQDCGFEWSNNAFVTFNTSCGTYTTPYLEGFELFTSATNANWPDAFCVTANPENTTAAYRWNPRTGTTPSNFSTGPSGAHEGSLYAFTEASQGVAGAIATLDLGPIDASALTVPALTFYYHMRGDTDANMGTLNVQVSTDGATWNTEFTLSGVQQSLAADPYLEALVPLAGYTGETSLHIRFQAIRGANFNGDIAIDAISLNEAPTCFPPTSTSELTVTATTADIDWTCVGCTGDFYIEYGAPGFTPGTDENAGTGTVVGPFASGPQQLTGLSESTNYEYVIRQDCGLDGFSANTAAGSFTTTCSPGIAPVSEGFEAYGTTTNATWPAANCIIATPSNTTASFRWNIEDLTTVSGGTGPTGPNTGTRYAHTEASSGAAGDAAILDFGLIDLSGLSNPALTFYYHMFGQTMGTLNAQVSTDGVTYNTEFSLTGQQQSATGDPWLQAIAPLGAYAGQTIYLRFEGIRGTDFWGDMAIDDVEVTEGPTCFAPTNLVLDAASTTDADVSWSCGGCTGDFYVEFGAPGFTPGTGAAAGGGTVVGPVAGTSATISPLTADTDYDVYLRQDCGIDGFSDNSPPLSIFTGYCTNVGPSNAADSNVGTVETSGFAGSGFIYDHCAPPGGPDAGFIGLNDQTAISFDVVEGFNAEITVEVAACDGSTFGGAHSVWIDWNNNLLFEPGEVIGSGVGNPVTNTYDIIVPPGTAIGPKRMRVTQQEGGALPLDPCASFTWGSVTDFTVEVVPSPGCLPTDADLTLDVSSCATPEFFINIDILSVGDSPGDEVTITNTFDGNTIPNATVAGSPYVYGPFPSGTDLDVSIEHGGNALCSYTTGFSYTCPPVNDDCADVTPVELTSGVPEVFSGTTVGATSTGDEAFAANPTVWHAIELTGVCNNVVIDYCGTAAGVMGNAWINLATACPATTFTPAGTFDTETCGDGNVTIYHSGLAAGIYYIPVMGFSDGLNDPGPYTLNVVSTDCPPPPTDFCEVGLSTSPGSFITTGSPVNSVLSVGPQAGGSIITDLDVVVAIDHTWVGDLTIELTSPCGTTVLLQDGACGNVDDMEAYYDDDSGLSFAAWCASRNGSVIPIDALSAFNNEVIEGDWTLTVTDNVGGDDGTLVQWCLVPTLDDICLAPELVVTNYTNTTITIDILADDCFNVGNYATFDVTWTGGGSANGVTFPYEITGLDSATFYLINVIANCNVGGSAPQTGVSQTTTNCDPVDQCTYDLTLANTSGSGWEGALARVDNGWSSTDYFMHPDSSSQTWEIIACPGNAISLEVVNGGNGALTNNLTISLVNSDGVEVYSENGPDETVLYNQSNGCPDCSSVNNISLTRIAADLVELTWSNIELLGNVDDIQVVVSYFDLFTFQTVVIGDETYPAGTTSASVPLNASYPFEFVDVQVITNCTNGGGAIGEVQTTLPACDAVDQCEYAFNMSSTDNGWIDTQLDALIDGVVSIDVALESGTSGTQSIFACPNGTLDVTAATSFGSNPVGCINTSPFGSATIPTTGALTLISGCNWATEYATVTINEAGIYEFSSEFATDYLTFTDASNNVIAAGTTPLEVSVPASGTYRLHIHTDSNCGTEQVCRDTFGQYIGPLGATCDSYTFSLVLNPSTDNVTLVSETDFCDYDDGDLVFSGTTCPTCFAPVDVEVTTVVDTNADFEWFSNNPAGTGYTVYVGLPGFTPGLDEVSSASGTTVAPGAQGPVNVTGLTELTDYEVIIVEDCGGGDLSDQSTPVPFNTTLANDDCANVTPVALNPQGSITFTGTSIGASDNSLNQSYGTGQVWEAIEVIGCTDSVIVSYCGTVPVADPVAAGLSTGCPAEFPGNYLFNSSIDWDLCGDGNATMYFLNLSEGIYYIPILEGVDYTVNVVSTGCGGCTDINAINYDPNANYDDGSCIIPTCDWPTLTTSTTTDCLNGTFSISLDIGNDGDAPDYDVYVIQPYCDEPQPGPGFPADQDCEDAICGADAFCCDTQWDGLCSGDAAINPACAGCLNPGDGGFIGTFIGGTTDIDLGSYTPGVEIELLVEHNADPDCHQTVFVSSNEICGCTDENAINYDPNATQDDGSCIVCAPGENTVQLDMTDSFGDGWNGATYTINNLSDPFNTVQVATGSIDNAMFTSTGGTGGGINAGTDYLCLPDGCYEIILTAGTWPGEIGWTLNDVDGAPVTGGAPATVQFTINSVCPVLGCIDPNAVNYDENANWDDGSCVYAPGNDDCVNAQSLNPAQYPNTQNVLGTLAGSSTDGSSACVGTNGPDVFYTFNVPLENHYWVNLNPIGGFYGVVEVLDACDGTVVACENAPPSAPFCDVTQGGTPGFPDNPLCEADMCTDDPFCCETSWDGVCGGNAIDYASCEGCLSAAPAGSGPISIFIQNLEPGDYIVRVRDYYGTAHLTDFGQFLVNVQYFPFAGVQDNPNSTLYACNQGGFQLEDFVGANPQSGQGALDYQWYIYEEGGTNSNEWQRGEPNYVARCTWLGMAYGTTYNVYVRIQLNVPGVGPVWGVYPYLNPTDPHAIGAASCTISTAANVTPTEVLPNYTPTNAGGNLYALCDFAIAYNVSESENFRWRFDPDTDPNNGNEIIYTRGSGNPSVRLSWVNGLLPGAIYNVAVEVMVDAQWSGYSTVLPIELALPPNNVVIRPQFCGETYAPTGYIMSQSVCDADLYQFRFTPAGGGTPSFRNSGNYVCFMSAANPPLTPGDYDVNVKVTQNGVPGDWGPTCVITIAGPQGQGGDESPALRDIESTTNATLFPNPNAGSEVRVELSGLGDGNHEVNVNVYDVYGKLISTDGFGHEGNEMSRLIRFNENLATGMYMIHVFVDGEQFTVERLVVK